MRFEEVESGRQEGWSYTVSCCPQRRRLGVIIAVTIKHILALSSQPFYVLKLDGADSSIKFEANYGKLFQTQIIIIWRCACCAMNIRGFSFPSFFIGITNSGRIFPHVERQGSPVRHRRT